uniref:Uncharacterized protein n=1 Tax=Vespula pensylvanica TaxID=30213 RepID=A0A834U3W0_VESPE|nr:hypothetical protein H0235_012058 [Vespula pensylvanica]
MRRIKLWSGDTGLLEMTTKSSVRPILTVNGSVLLRISTSTHRSSHSTHSPQVITKKSNYGGGDTFPPTTPIKWTSTTTELNCGVGILGFVRRQQSRAFDRLWFNINGSVLPRISTSTHRSSRSTHSLEWGYSPTHTDNISGPTATGSVLPCFEFRPVPTQFSQYPFSASNRAEFKLRSGDIRLRQRKTKTVLRPTLTVTSPVVLWTSTRELRKFRGGHPCKLNWEVGILGRERGKQRRASGRLLHFLVQLCFGLRRGNLEKFRGEHSCKY